MTATSHNKILGILHLAYGGLIALLMLAISIYMLMIGAFATNNRGEPMPAGVLALIIIVVAAVTLL
ncbi:MAG: hypothetical protein ACREBC_36815, partial [Pyrinomonadaceae bacterium]